MVGVLGTVGEVLGGVHLLQTRSGGGEGGLAEEEALKNIGREDERVLDGVNQTILGANVGLDDARVEVEVDGRKGRRLLPVRTRQSVPSLFLCALPVLSQVATLELSAMVLASRGESERTRW